MKKLEEERRKLTKQLKAEEELKQALEDFKQNALKREDELKTHQTRLLLEKEEYRVKILELDKKIEQMEIAVKNDDTKSIIDQKDQLIKSLKEESQTKLDQLQSEKEEAVKKLSEELQAIIQERETLKSNYKELENKKEEVDSELSKLENKKISLEEKIESQTKEIAKLNENIQNLKAEVDSQEKQIEKRDENIKTLRSQLDEILSSAESLEEKNKKIQEANKSDADVLRVELAGVKTENSILKDKWNQLEGAQNKIIERLDTAKSDLMKNIEALAKSEAENSELKRQIQLLNEQVDDLKKKLNHEKQSAERSIRLSTIGMMALKKTMVKKVIRAKPIISSTNEEEDEGELDEVHEEVISGPLTRKSTIVQRKVKYNGQEIDRSILDKPDWQLSAQEKYQKIYSWTLWKRKEARRKT